MAQPEIPRAAYSIKNSAKLIGFPRACTTNLRDHGLGPREARALTKVIITQEAAADWRRQREQQPEPAQ